MAEPTLANPMTYEEFSEQVYRLHKRFPHLYSRGKQVAIAFCVSGLPLDWFKTRVDYVIKSGNGNYDWSVALRLKASAVCMINLHTEPQDEVSVKKMVDDFMGEMSRATAIPENMLRGDYQSTSFQGMLEREGVSSATELLDKLSKKGGKDE